MPYRFDFILPELETLTAIVWIRLMSDNGDDTIGIGRIIWIPDSRRPWF